MKWGTSCAWPNCAFATSAILRRSIFRSLVTLSFVGNVVGKSNLLFAIRLVLDPTLPNSVRQLELSDFWDGCDWTTGPQIEVHVDFADFDDDDALIALLTDFRIAADPTIARLSYVYRKKPEVTGLPQSGEDCEFIVYGGGDKFSSGAEPVVGVLRLTCWTPCVTQRANSAPGATRHCGRCLRTPSHPSAVPNWMA